ncbi:MAG TPA: hypothetical protein VFU11_10255 [Solirubrobacterales bacterium]|nr:hypothetical protein [Solirubrobacterales bacterium]
MAAADADAIGPQFPISSGNHPSEGLQAGFQDEVFSEKTGQYLVVYVAATTAETDDIYGQLVDVNGNLVGSEFRISTTSADHAEYNPASVGYDSETGRYLVVWDRDETVQARVLNPDGTPVTGETPIAAKQEDIETEAIAYSPVTHEYLVAWKAYSDGRVYVQRLNQDGGQVGPDDEIVGGSATLRVDDALDLAYSATSHEYMIVFNAELESGGGEEVFGQRLDLGGNQIGNDDFPISEMGPPGDASTTFDAAPPSIVWNSTQNQYLVAWHGNDGVPPFATGEREVFGQLLSADGTQIGADDFRISDVGTDGDANSNAFRPRMAYDPFGNQYLVAWHGDENISPLIDNEFEIYGQYLAADGAEIGNNDFRISDIQPDGNKEFSANRPQVAYNTVTCDYLVSYFSGEPNSTDDADSTVYGRRVAGSVCPDRTAPTLSGLKVTPKKIASGIKPKPRKQRKATATTSAAAKTVPKRAKARYTLSEAAAVVFTVERKVQGKKVGGKCRKLKKGEKPAGKRCALWVRTGKKLKQTGVAGANAKSFTAKSIRKKGLKPGAYRILAVATDAAGNASSLAAAKFKVVQPR